VLQAGAGRSDCGFVTRGRGVTIHHANCVNMLNSSESERLIEVSWGTSQRTYPVTIKISAYDRDGLLRDVATVVAGENVSMRQRARDDQQKPGHLCRHPGNCGHRAVV